MSAPTTAPLADALRDVRDRVADVRLGLATPDAAAATRAARAVVEQVDDYLLPRLRDLDAPLLAVVGGSTGAGKSTLVNSLVGAQASAAGVLRPTTRAPVLVCAPQDLRWFSGDRVLPGLARLTGTGAGPGEAPPRAAAPTAGQLQVVPLAQLPAGLALLDAPDVDSVVASNRDLAAQLLAAADLWLFVTTASRYADAVPWDVLRTAQERGTALAVVLDRVPPEAVGEVEADLRAMLVRADLPDARLFVVQERPLQEGRLPVAETAPIRDWLHALAVDAEARATVVRQTLTGALDSLGGRVASVATAVEGQRAAAGALEQATEAAYDVARTEVDEGVRSGTVLRGEVLARWQDFVGTGELMRSLETRFGRLRDRLAATVTGRPQPGEQLAGALESSVEVLLRTAADRAAERTVTAWLAAPGGAELLRGRERDLDRASDGFAGEAAAQVREWQGHVLELVREQGAGRRSAARLLSFGVNGAGLAVMVAVFAHTGGLSGGEVVVAGGTSAASQKLLEVVFGDAAVRSLAARARTDLAARAGDLMASEQRRFSALLAGAVPDGDTAASLRVALAALQTARRP